MISVTIPITPETAERLSGYALTAGMSLEDYLIRLAEWRAGTPSVPPPAAGPTPGPVNAIGLYELTADARRFTDRTPEQVAADRAEVMKTVRPGRPLPEGKTLFDVVERTWPGDESDEEIRKALDELS